MRRIEKSPGRAGPGRRQLWLLVSALGCGLLSVVPARAAESRTTSPPPPLCAIALPASTTDKAIRVYVDAIEAPSADIQVGVSNGDSFTIENRSNNETLVVLNAQKRPLDPHGSTTVAPASIFDGQGAIWDTDPTYAQQHAVDVSNKPSTYLRWTIYLQGSTRTTRVSGHTDLLPRHEGTFIECTGAWATIIGTSVGLTLLYLLIFLGPPLVVVLFIVYVITRLRRGARQR